MDEFTIASTEDLSTSLPFAEVRHSAVVVIPFACSARSLGSVFIDVCVVWRTQQMYTIRGSQSAILGTDKKATYHSAFNHVVAVC